MGSVGTTGRGRTLRATVGALVCATMLLAAAPRASCEDDELHKMVDLLLSGEEVTSVAKLLAFDEAAERTPIQMRQLAEVVRRHAETWRTRRLKYDGSVELVDRVHQLATQVQARHAASADAHLAVAEASLARAYERMNRHIDGSFDDHFGPAVQAFEGAAALDADHAMAHRLRIVGLYRVESEAPGADRGALLAKAVELLAAMREQAPEDRAVRAEAGRVAAAHVRQLLASRQAGPAKKAFLEALELLRPPEGTRPTSDEAGAYNTLVELGLEEKLAPRGTTYLAETTQRGGFTLQFPLGTGWGSEGYPTYDVGETRIYANQATATGGRVQIVLASFSWDTNYGDVGGDNAKGLFDMIQEQMQMRLANPKAKNESSRALPRWAQKASGTRIEANDREGQPVTWWLWVWKSKEHMLTYSLLVGLEGAKTKDLPGQTAFVLDSLVEPPR